MNDKKTREERLSLKENRDIKYDNLRRNLRILRASLDISAVELSKKIPLKSANRCMDLEYGRGNPTIDELIDISSYFKVPIDDLLQKKAVITFQ